MGEPDDPTLTTGASRLDVELEDLEKAKAVVAASGDPNQANRALVHLLFEVRDELRKQNKLLALAFKDQIQAAQAESKRKKSEKSQAKEGSGPGG